MPHALTRLLLAIGWAILATTAHARDLLFQNVNVVPMDRERVLLGQSVLVQDGRIAAIGRRLRVPPDTDRINGRGKLWLSPGLADMHIHSDTADDLVAYLASGITTVVNMGDARASFVGRTTPAATRGDIPAPQVFNAFVLDGSPQYGHFTVVTPDEGRAAVRLARTNGYRMIKVYNNLQPAVFAAAAAEAKSQEMPLVGHGVTSVGLAAQIGQGQTLVAHAEEFFYTFFSPPGSHQTDAAPAVERIPEAIRLVQQKEVAVGADLITFATISRLIGHPEYLERCLAAPSADLVAPADRLSWRRTTYIGKTADLTAKLAFLRQLLKAMADANVELLSGTDAPSIPCVAPGVSLHDNLDELRSAVSRLLGLPWERVVTDVRTRALEFR